MPSLHVLADRLPANSCTLQGSNHCFLRAGLTGNGSRCWVLIGEPFPIPAPISIASWKPLGMCCLIQSLDFYKQKHYSGVKLAKVLNWQMWWWADLVVGRQRISSNHLWNTKQPRLLEKERWRVASLPMVTWYFFDPIMSKGDLLYFYLMLPSRLWVWELQCVPW